MVGFIAFALIFYSVPAAFAGKGETADVAPAAPTVPATTTAPSPTTTPATQPLMTTTSFLMKENPLSLPLPTVTQSPSTPSVTSPSVITAPTSEVAPSPTTDAPPQNITTPSLMIENPLSLSLPTGTQTPSTPSAATPTTSTAPPETQTPSISSETSPSAETVPTGESPVANAAASPDNPPPGATFIDPNTRVEITGSRESGNYTEKTWTRFESKTDENKVVEEWKWTSDEELTKTGDIEEGMTSTNTIKTRYYELDKRRRSENGGKEELVLKNSETKKVMDHRINFNDLESDELKSVHERETENERLQYDNDGTNPRRVYYFKDYIQEYFDSKGRREIYTRNYELETERIAMIGTKSSVLTTTLDGRYKGYYTNTAEDLNHNGVIDIDEEVHTRIENSYTSQTFVDGHLAQEVKLQGTVEFFGVSSNGPFHLDENDDSDKLRIDGVTDLIRIIFTFIITGDNNAGQSEMWSYMPDPSNPDTWVDPSDTAQIEKLNKAKAQIAKEPALPGDVVQLA